MFVERRINPTTHVVELWMCDWENVPGQPAHKVQISKIGDEQPVADDGKFAMNEASAICWSYGRTLGNIAVFNQQMLGSFPDAAGSDATLPCDIVGAGKFRHGANRWWCRTHQSYWGTVADVKALSTSGQMVCAQRAQPMNYVVKPFVIDLTKHAEVGIWCSLPVALATTEIRPRAPRIHVHVREEHGGHKQVDQDFPAVAIDYQQSLGMFANAEITRVNVTPPAAFEFVRGLETNREMSCISCTHCGYPHLDLGDFATKPHRKHTCANCGSDSTWSETEVVSTPLKPLHDAFMNAEGFVVPKRTLNLDEYAGCDYALYASTPAILWTAKRPQEVGIHAHVRSEGKRIIDDTYGEVMLDGKRLERGNLLAMMIERTKI